MTDYSQEHVEVVAKLLRARVVGSHHKQQDTIVNWCGGFEGDVIRRAIDDLITDPYAPVHEKGRGTITLTSIQDAKEFISEHDDEDEYLWFL